MITTAAPAILELSGITKVYGTEANPLTVLHRIDLEVTNFGGRRRYSGVWLPGRDAYYLWVNAPWQSFRQKWEELGQQNLRLIDLEVTAPGDPSGSPPIGEALEVDLATGESVEFDLER